MKGKLIKYKQELIVNFCLKDENNNTIALTKYPFPSESTYLAESKGITLQKLSLSNCQAIENAYDLDELVEKELPYKVTRTDFATEECRKIWIDGFQKAVELMGDKKFSEGDLDKAFELGKHVEREDCTKNYLTYKQSLQQTEWDVTFNPEEKDSEGCLILKRL